MNKTLFILLLFTFNINIAQNLVPNPSFEVFDTCPSGISQAFDYQIERALGWYAPTWATSDYFNECSPLLGGANIPNTGFGYQFSFDGNGMLGILMELDSGETSYFEYAQAKLIQPLLQGYNYKFSFNVNLVNGSDFAAKKIGAWFTANAVSSNNGLPLFSVNPQIENTTGFITDTLDWRRIEGEFTATGGEEYITIGYYTDTLNIDTVRNNPIADPLTIFVYYFIDGVELEEAEQAVVIPNIITPNNDGSNDIFRLNFLYESVVVYNRWGQKLFESNNNESFWNGRTTSGNEVPDGTYYYIIVTEEETFKGFVQVIR